MNTGKWTACWIGAVLGALAAGAAECSATDVGPALRPLIEADWVAADRQFTAQPAGPARAAAAAVTTAEDAAGGCDGIKNGLWGFHVASGERDPWWQVDLGRNLRLDRIVVYNRCGSSAARTSRLDVLVAGSDGDDACKTFRTVYQHDGTPFFGVEKEPLVVRLAEQQVTARIVRLRVPGRCSFALDEVEVYAADDAQVNVALGRPADQISVGPYSRRGTMSDAEFAAVGFQPLAPADAGGADSGGAGSGGAEFSLQHTRAVLEQAQQLAERLAATADPERLRPLRTWPAFVLVVVPAGLAGAAEETAAVSAGDAEQTKMLAGDWFRHPHAIDFEKLPKVPRQHVVISDVTVAGGVNQHNYLAYFAGRFWAMWSDGPAIEDRVGQVVKYATSDDGLGWSEPAFLTDYPPHSGPESPHYNTRRPVGFRYIARGFWVRDGQLLALVSLDEAAGFFGPSLQLLAYRWHTDEAAWERLGVVYDNAINNFPPKQLPTGEWMMSRRPHDYSRAGIELLIGGVEAFDHWEAFPVPRGALAAEEPCWWTLPDGRLAAMFRDNRASGYIYRSLSTDNGRTWSPPLRTDFPDARSKFHGLRMSDGRYVLVSNTHPRRRDPLTLAVSDDGMVFDRLFYLVGGQRNGVDYPMVMEQEGYLYIAHSGGHGGRKQSVEVQRVSIADLDRLEMADARAATTR